MWFDVDAALAAVCGFQVDAGSHNSGPTAANGAKSANPEPHQTTRLAGLARLAGSGLGKSVQHDAHVADWMDRVERAAIIEFDGSVSRLRAEKRAGITK